MLLVAGWCFIGSVLLLDVYFLMTVGGDGCWAFCFVPFTLRSKYLLAIRLG